MKSLPTASAPRVAFTSLGCKVNYAEMAQLAGEVASFGCEVVPESEPADIRVLNSCTVTMQADATTRQRLRRLRKDDPNAYLILTGCSVDANPETYLRPASVPGIDAVFANPKKSQIGAYIRNLIASAGDGATPPLPNPEIPVAGRSRAFIKIQDGCNHRCTYCIVWQARGVSQSTPVEVVRQRVLHAAQAHGEVVLTGVDLGSYGRDLDTTLAALLERLLDEIPETSRIRLSSINANDITKELITLNAHPRLCSHWHMPLQSGSDNILKAMHRGYRRAQYLRVASELREKNPDTEFTSDVMVAFPGETEGDHQATLQLIEEVGFLACHTFRYSPRPGTPAAESAAKIDDSTAQRRSRAVRRMAAGTGQAARERAVGKKMQTVWDRVSAAEAHGITDTYHEVVCPASAQIRTARLTEVEITGIEGETLRAKLPAA